MAELGVFGKRGVGTTSAQARPAKADKANNPFQRKDSAPAGLLTSDWKRMTLICAVAILAVTLGWQRFAEIAKSPAQKAAEQAALDNATKQAEAAKAGALKAASKPWLHVSGFKCVREYGFMNVSGMVRNDTSKSIDGLMAVGIFRQSNGEGFKTADAMVDFQPLLPGQTSPFKAMTTDNPAFSRCGLMFKTMFGGEISSDYGS